jgi:hypothetical protein
VTSLTATLSVSWESTGAGWQPIPAAYLYSGSLIARIRVAYSRFVKTTSLASALSLTAAEIAYLAADPDFAVSGQSWLNMLPAVGAPDPASQTVWVSGAITAGDVLTTTINGVAIPYTVAATDTNTTILAGSIAIAINATVAADPLTGLPLNHIVTASSTYQVVTITAVAPGAALTVTCSSSGATESFFAGDAVPSVAAGLTRVLSNLLDYARVKAALSPKDERLLPVVQDPTMDALTALTGWDPFSVSALLEQLFGSTDITNIGHVENLRRLYDAYTIVKASGISADKLIPAVTTDPTPGVAADLQAAVRSRYTETDWLAVVKPINDTMRGLQRDALVACVLQQLGDQGPASPAAGINTADKLFEYLLMDVQMEPCAQTSRIRHALSSVQLFTEMCLRNLVPQVSPQDIPAGWEWRQRYRLWKANLETFVWPENWLDPELRTDQSPFFKQTLNQLLQGDQTDDAATTAYLGYLTKLASVAKLEPAGIWSDGTNCDVIARTPGGHPAYYHRQLQGAFWTPWEEIKLGIEDNPVVPYVWNGRLLLFWLRITQAPVDGSLLSSASGQTAANTALTNLTYGDMFPTQAQAAATTTVNVNAVLCYSEYVNGQWQPAKTSDPNRPTSLGTFAAGTFDRSQLELSVLPAWLWGWSVTGDNSQIWVQIDTDQSVPVKGGLVYPDPEPPWFPPVQKPSSGILTGFLSGFLLYNTHSLPIRNEDAMLPAPVDNSGERRYFLITLADHTLWTGYSSPSWSGSIATHPLTSMIGMRTVQSQLGAFPSWSPTTGAWFSPFFVEDSRHVFYVTTSGSPPANVNTDFGASATGIRPTAAPARLIPPLLVQRGPTSARQGAAMPYLIPSHAPVTYNGRLITENGSVTGSHAMPRSEGD